MPSRHDFFCVVCFKQYDTLWIDDGEDSYMEHESTCAKKTCRREYLRKSGFNKQEAKTLAKDMNYDL